MSGEGERDDAATDGDATADGTSDAIVAAGEVVASGEVVSDSGGGLDLSALGFGTGPGGGVDEGAGGLGAGLDLGSMLQMAQDMGQRMQEAQEELSSTEVQGTSGGGVVSVTLNGHLHLLGVHIDPTAVDLDDLTMLEDLIVAAWSDARDSVAELQAQADPLGGMGGMGGLGGLLGG